MLRHHQNLAYSGSVHFITTVARVRGKVFQSEKVCRGILELFEGYRARSGMNCLGYVLMPDHLHALLHQPEPGNGVIRCIADFKKMSSLRYMHVLNMPRGIWQAGYDDVPLPSLNAINKRLEYMAYNPVRRGLAERPENYMWSSVRHQLELGNGSVTLTFMDSMGGICQR